MECERLCLILQEVSFSIQQLVCSPSVFIVHRTRCHCLARSYDLAVRHVTALVHRALDYCTDQSSLETLLPSLSELHHVMLQGRKFLQDCSLQDGWVRKALVLAFSTEAENVCLHDLVWCLCAIHHEALRQLPVALLGLVDYVFRSLNRIWDDSSQMDDLQTLMEALDDEISEFDDRISRHARLTNVLKKLKAQRSQAKFLRDKLHSKAEFSVSDESHHILPECLWMDPDYFIIKEAIGRGAFSVVYEVEWGYERFAQKEFFGVEKSFLGSEAVIQSRLTHPNLLQLICCTSKPSRNKCSMVTELMEMDLRCVIDNRCKRGFDPPFPLLTAVDVMLQMSKGMEYLHGLRIMHRDLKSPNVLINSHICADTTHDSGRMQVKIADFGNSKANVSSKFSTLRVGTLYWRAPELLKAKGKELEAKYTKKADVYSFAMVCYEILSGKVPFENGGKPKDLRKRVARGERPILPTHCPQYLASYVERCWHGNPQKRPSFAQISRTMRHLKGILLGRVDPIFPPVLLNRSCTDIEDKLEQTIGSEWVSIASGGLASSSMTISFEMYWYKVMESKLMEQVLPDINRSRSRASKVGCLYWLPFGCCRLKDTYPMDAPSQVKFDQIDTGCQNTLQQFTFADLKQASNGFSECVGIGGAGHVYKATLSDGQAVAVKVFTGRRTDGSEKAIIQEVQLLGRIFHRNLVPLLGFCNARGHLYLVYKFMPGGDLESLRTSGVVLTWSQKYTIVRGVAVALNYLHNGCPWQVLHRDAKPSNILLDQNLEACLADFGISRLLPSDESHITTNVKGTMGYMAPEYVATLQLGPEADVFSFGVVVLELACDRRCIERSATNAHIIAHVWAMYKRKSLLDAVKDSQDHCNKEELKRLLLLGLACTQSNPKDRPDMKSVVDILSKKVKAPTPVRRPRSYM